MYTSTRNPIHSSSPRSSNHKRVLTHRDHDQIRANFYRKLGLLSPCHATISSCRSTPDLNAGFTKQGQKDDDEYPTSPTSTVLPHRKYRRQSSLKTKKDPRLPAWNVTFRLEPTVVEIPSHEDYDIDTWLQMWDFPDTVKRERKRNAFEFAADACNWREATEEEAMILTSDGMRVHPATFWSDRWQRKPTRGEHRLKRPNRFSPLLLEMEMEPPPCLDPLAA